MTDIASRSSRAARRRGDLADLVCVVRAPHRGRSARGCCAALRPQTRARSLSPRWSASCTAPSTPRGGRCPRARTGSPARLRSGVRRSPVPRPTRERAAGSRDGGSRRSSEATCSVVRDGLSVRASARIAARQAVAPGGDAASACAAQGARAPARRASTPRSATRAERGRDARGPRVLQRHRGRRGAAGRACTRVLNAAEDPLRPQGRRPSRGLRPLRRGGALPGRRRLRPRARLAAAIVSTCAPHLRTRAAGVHEAARPRRRRRRASSAAWARASARAAAGWSPRGSSPRTRAAPPALRIASTPSPAASRTAASTSTSRIWPRDPRTL